MNNECYRPLSSQFYKIRAALNGYRIHVMPNLLISTAIHKSSTHESVVESHNSNIFSSLRRQEKLSVNHTIGLRLFSLTISYCQTGGQPVLCPTASWAIGVYIEPNRSICLKKTDRNKSEQHIYFTIENV